MKIIKGYCCLAGVRGLYPMQVLFGKNEGQRQGSFSAMTMNGLTPFLSKKMAKIAKSELRHRNDVISVAIVGFYLTIAEKEAEIDQLSAKSNYVVIWEQKQEKTILLLGSYVEGKPHIYPLLGAYLCYNGYTLIKDVQTAKNICCEVNRQGGGNGYIGTLDIKFIK